MLLFSGWLKLSTDEDGDIRKVLVTMVSSPEFWHKDAVREKTKSPVEVITSSIRVLNATITDPRPLIALVHPHGRKNLLLPRADRLSG